MNKTKNGKKLSKKWLAITLLAVLVMGTGIWRILIYKPASEVITTAGRPSPGPRQNSSANSPPPKKQPVSNTGRAIGGGTDTKGQTSGASTNPNQWITSKSGAITVEQPAANATMHSSDVLSGTAKVGTIDFRLIDNTAGVISEGTLTVVNGKFSGKLSFAAHSSSGRLDIFSTGDNGVELNGIQIAVKY